jgi:AraC-like DNA-binding protein
MQMVAYLVPALGRFHRYQDSLADRVSNLDRVDLGWLRSFFWVASALCLLSVVVLVLLHSVAPVTLTPWISGVMTVAVWVLGFRGLVQKSPGPPVSQADRPPLAEPEAQRLAESLKRTFEDSKPHLDPELDLGTLARLVGVPRNQLSFVINKELGMNFYDLVNGWRVREFRSLAAAPGRRDDKILTLAFDAGFNSKPTFNKVVLKMTGKTPSQVRNEEIESHRVH